MAAARSSTPFTVVAAPQSPSVSGLSASVIDRGSALTVNGSGFSATASDDAVAIGQTRGLVQTASASSLTFTVPTAANSGHVLVGTPNGSTTSSADVFVPPTGWTAAQVETTGRMAVGDTGRAFTITDPAKIGLVVFDGTAGQSVFLHVPTTAFIANVKILDPLGLEIASTAVGPSSGYVDTLKLPTTGTYTILLDPLSGSGSITLSLYDAAPSTGTIQANGQPLSVSIPTPGQNAQRTFTGSADQRVFLKIDSQISAIVVRELDVNGFEIASTTVGQTSGYIDTRTLAAQGTYTIVVDPLGAATGNVTLTLYDVPADVTGTLTPGPANQTPTNVTLSTGQNAVYMFTATDQQRVSVKIAPPSSGTAIAGGYLKLTDANDNVLPDGSVLFSLPFSWSVGFVDTHTLAAGTYKVVVDPTGANAGSANLNLYDVPADLSGTISIGGPSVTASIGTPGQNAAYTFTGTGGQNVNLALSGSTIAQGTVRIVEQGQQNPVASKTFFTSPTTLPATLPADDTYRAEIDPASANTGDVTLTLTQGALRHLKAQRTRPHSAASPRPAAKPRRHPVVLPRFKPGSTERWTPETAEPSTWFTGRAESPFEFLPARRAPMGTTAVSGRVLRLDGRPLPHVTLRGGGARTTSDRTGRFLLRHIRVGHFVLTVDSRTANRPGVRYGVYEIGVDTKRGRTTVLPFTIWSPLLDTKHEVALHYPLKHELVLKNPLIPHLEVRIPAGSLIRDRQGRLVHRLGITPVPLDRSPFPMPGRFPIYFTVQPGAAYVWPHGVEVIYPNKFHAARGQRVGFFSYDPRGKGWHQYGKGTVTRDGKQIRFDRGTRQYELTSSGICSGCVPSFLFGFFWGWTHGGDPVDLASGNLNLAHTDLVEAGRPQIDVSRIYRSQDTASRAFGVGMSMTYSMALYQPDAHNFSSVDLVFADGSHVHYNRISPGTGYSDAVYEQATSGGDFYKSRIAWNGRVWELTRTDGSVYTFSNGGVLESIRDRYGNETAVFRTNGVLGEITQILASSGRWLKLTVDPITNRTTQVTDQSGRSITYDYDAGGHLWKVHDPRGGTAVTEYLYDGSGRLQTVKDFRGFTSLTNHYDANGRVDQQTLADGTSAYHFAYQTDGNGNVVQTDVTNPRGYVDRLTFDSEGTPLTWTRALGTPRQQATSFEYQSGTKLLLAQTDQRGRRTEYQYNSAGKVTRITQLAGTSGAVSTNFTYDPAFQQLTGVTDPLNHGPSLDYNARGALTGITDARLKHTTVVPNLDGQPASITDPLNHQTTYGYFLGDQTKVVDPAGGISRTFYDPAGRPVRITNRRGATTKLAYDATDALTSITDPGNNTTSFLRDGNGNVTKITDARLHDTSFTYDSMDRVATRTDPLLKGESYDYDANGNLTRFTDRKSQITTYQYDELDRRTSAAFGSSSTINYTWDTGNRLTQAVDSAYGTITRVYDELDRLTSETSPEGTISYTYDDADRRLTATVTGQPQVSYAYNNANQTTSVTRGSLSVGITYDDAGAPASVTLPDGVVESYSYDSASNLTGITYQRGQTTLGDLQYGYDAGGLRIGMGGTYARTSLPTAVSSASYDADNRLTSWAGTSMTYDLNGNLIKEGNKKNFTWNPRNQLSGLSGSVTAALVYDPFGRRTSSTVSGAQTRFLYDGDTAVQEQNASRSPTANLLLGPETDERYATIDTSGNARSVLTDALGSTIALADAAGVVQTSYTYEPFGKATASGATGKTYQYTGRENDGATALQYSRARYYDAIRGRFISEDPLGFAGGGANLYAYVGDNPINNVDPTGLAGTAAARIIPIPGFDEVGYGLGGYAAGSAARKWWDSGGPAGGGGWGPGPNGPSAPSVGGGGGGAGPIDLHMAPIPAPPFPPGIPGLHRAPPKTPVQGGGGLRRRWKDNDGNIYEWDSQHGTVEKYDRRGRHVGEFDPDTGEQIGPAVPGRRVEP
jgi:RHS repeat-associated protein